MSYEASTTPPAGWRGWTFSPQGSLSPLSLLCPYPQLPRPLLEAGPFAFMPSSPAQLMLGSLASSLDTSSQCSNKISLSCQSLSTFMLGPRDHSFIHSFKQSMLTKLHSQALSLPESFCVFLVLVFICLLEVFFSLTHLPALVLMQEFSSVETPIFMERVSPPHSPICHQAMGGSEGPGHPHPPCTTVSWAVAPAPSQASGWSSAERTASQTGSDPHITSMQGWTPSLAFPPAGSLNL